MKNNILKIIGPGLLIAATGVGAGDLAGGAFAGSKLGITVLWAVLLGAFFKYIITEGLARYQLTTGSTILEGLFIKFGRPLQIFFFIYLVIWSFAVGSALISACGVAAHALFSVFDSSVHGKIFWGILHSLIGLVIVWFGNYKSFEKVMSIAVGFMFLTVLITAIFIKPDFAEIIEGIFIPSIPEYINPAGNEQGVVWTLALMGGVGGTLTILSYGYWIREKGRVGQNMLKTCRIDLAAAYFVTALFGICMIIISSQIDLDRESSSKLVINLTDKLKEIIGNTGSIIFLVGAWAAVVSSLLGVWQSVPYMFADFWEMFKKISIYSTDLQIVDTKGTPYRVYLLCISIISIWGLIYKFVFIQKIYAVLGSLVIPFISLAILLLGLDSKSTIFKNKLSTNILLVLIILIFVYIGLPQIFNLF